MKVKDKLKQFFNLKTLVFLLIIPMLSIIIYKMVSEPLLTKTIVKESLVETMSEQPEIILDGIVGILPKDGDNITEQERNILREEISRIITDNYSRVTEKMGLDLDSLMQEVEALKLSSATKQEVRALRDELNKIKSGLAENAETNTALDELTREEIESITEEIEEIEKELIRTEEVDNNLAGKISEVLDKLTALKKNMNAELDKLRQQISLLEKETNSNTDGKINDVQKQIDALNELHRSLDTRLAEFIKAVNIESLNEMIANFALSISSLDAGLSDVQNSVDRIDLSMVTLEDMLNSNIDNVDETLKAEIQDVLTKMKKLSEDVYDKSIVDKHIEAIQGALDNIMANAGELDEELKNKFSKAQKDLEALKQETESGYYDKIAVNNKITEINSSLSEGLAQISSSADKNLQDAITKVESDFTDFGKNVEAAYKQAINKEVSGLKNELQASINAAAEANRQNSDDISNLQGETTNISNSISQLAARLDAMDGDFANLTAQLEAVKTNVTDGYYTKEQLDALVANIQTALDAIKADVKNNGEKATGNAEDIAHNITAVTNLETSLTALNESISADMQNVNGRIGSLDTRVNECFQSVSDGKALVAAAITDKGASTAVNASYQQMANNIHGISTGTKVRYWVLGGNGSVNIASELGNIHTQLNKDDFIVSAEYGGGGFKAGGDGDEWTGWGKCTYEYNPSTGILTATHQDWHQNNEKSARQQWELTRGQIYIIYKGRL